MTHLSEPQLPHLGNGWVTPRPPRVVVRSIRGDGSGLGRGVSTVLTAQSQNTAWGCLVGCAESGQCTGNNRTDGSQGHRRLEEGDSGVRAVVWVCAPCEEVPKHEVGGAVRGDRGVNSARDLPSAGNTAVGPPRERFANSSGHESPHSSRQRWPLWPGHVSDFKDKRQRRREG